MNQTPIIEIDVHGLTVDQALVRIESVLKRANPSTYRIRVVHGYNRGNKIQRGIYRELDPEFYPRVVRVIGGENPGITEIVLKEF